VRHDNRVAMTRRNLVICRAGRNSLHPRWLRDAATRNWDLVVSAYHDDTPLGGEERLVHRIAGAKLPGLADLFARHWDVIEDYDRVWLPDDDLDVDQATLNHMFDLATRYDLRLFQPALTPESYISWAITLRHAGFRLRFTNFVEIMAPGFALPLLKQVRESFGTSIIGWGLDFLWPRFTELGQTAIIDATPVHHSRPVGGTMKWAGFANEAERTAAIGRWTAQYIPDINWRMAINFGGIATDGGVLSYRNDEGAIARFVDALEAGIAGIAVKPTRPPNLLTDYIATHRAFGRARNKVGLFAGIEAVLAERLEALRRRGDPA
jgi:hypothetical protein